MISKSFLYILLGVFIGYPLPHLLFFQWKFTTQSYNLSIINNHNHSEDLHRLEDSSVADALAKKVRVLCWIMTQPANHQNRAAHIKVTWGKRCNVLLFMSSFYDESLPSVPLPVLEGPDYLWGKTKSALKYIYRNYYDDADWFLKADDDTYVIVENLRFMLMNHSSSDPIYFGRKFKPSKGKEYAIGGAGIVLSKKALSLFIKKGIPDPKLCKQGIDGADDEEMTKCLENIGVKLMDDRDSMNRKRFFPFNVENYLPLRPSDPSWYLSYEHSKDKQGFDCCSNTAISFHYVDPNHMYVYEYFLYHLRPYDVKIQDNINMQN